MADGPDFSKMSKSELNHFMTQFQTTHTFYKQALAELSRREISINQIPTLPEDVLMRRLSIPDIPDARGKPFPPVNEAEKIAISTELRKRETERNIKAIASAPKQKFHDTFWGRVFITVTGGIILIFCGYFINKYFLNMPQQQQQLLQSKPISTTVNRINIPK
jgi:hypothetical protein